MAYAKSSYLQHVAVYVKDIRWYTHFFAEALGMPISRVAGDPDNPQQIWTVGGMQLVSAPDFAGPEGRVAHLGIYTDDLEAALEEVYKWDVTELPQGRNWVKLPDGLQLEIMQDPQTK